MPAAGATGIESGNDETAGSENNRAGLVRLGPQQGFCNSSFAFQVSLSSKSPVGAQDGPRGLRGRKYSYCESTTAVHFSDLFRYVELLCSSKDRKTVLVLALSRYGYFYRADPWPARLISEPAGSSLPLSIPVAPAADS